MRFHEDAIPFIGKEKLACKGSGVIKLDMRFAVAFPLLWMEWLKLDGDQPLDPNSVCRTPAHNAKEGGHIRSLHLTENPTWPTWGSMAIDIPWRIWGVDRKLKFARLAWKMGWSVGLHDGFCHLDRRADMGLPQLPQHVFLYGTWSNHFSPESVRA